jgi:hypothetical protein
VAWAGGSGRNNERESNCQNNVYIAGRIHFLKSNRLSDRPSFLGPYFATTIINKKNWPYSAFRSGNVVVKK